MTTREKDTMEKKITPTNPETEVKVDEDRDQAERRTQAFKVRFRKSFRKLNSFRFKG